jgi:hypothetical protein
MVGDGECRKVALTQFSRPGGNTHQLLLAPAQSDMALRLNKGRNAPALYSSFGQ